jgi:4-hydroxy-tetrahydrodipicolinate synthase
MKKKIIFKGAASALITPFRNGEIDYGALEKIINSQIDGGIDALVIGGTTGEAATLSDSERERLYFFAMEKIDRRVPLILGTGCNDTKKALEHTKLANRVGCDGTLVVTPYYNKGTEEGVYRHYLTLAEASDSPLMLYNVPSRTGVNLGINLLSRLSEHPNIVAIKEASETLDRLVTLATLSDSLKLYAGNDSQIYPVLALGGVGVISVVSNILPRAIKDLFRNYFDGKQKESLEMQLKLLPLISALFTETNPAPIKYAMSRLGYCSEEVRLPLDVPRESTKVLIDARITELREHFL